MKPSFLIVALAVGITAQAQTSPKLKNDPGYSPNNYKHANKAAEARTWEENQNLTVTVPTLETARIPRDAGNYKRPGVNRNQETGIVRVRAREVDQQTNPSLSERNYKVSGGTAPAQPSLAKRPSGNASGNNTGE